MMLHDERRRIFTTQLPSQASSFSPAVFYAVSPLRQDFPQGQTKFDRPEAKRGLTEARAGMTGTTFLVIDGGVVFKRKDWAKMPLRVPVCAKTALGNHGSRVRAAARAVAVTPHYPTSNCE